MPIVKAGAVYFLLAFAAGWVLGPLREFVVVPHFGAAAGVLIEAPFMLLAVYVAARFVVRRFAVPPATGRRLALGAVAFVLLIAAEFVTTLGLRGQTATEYLAHFATASGAISLTLFAIFALMPLVVMRR